MRLRDGFTRAELGISGKIQQKDSRAGCPQRRLKGWALKAILKKEGRREGTKERTDLARESRG